MGTTRITKNFLDATARGERLLPHLKRFLLEDRKKQGDNHRDVVVQDSEMTIACFQERLDKYKGKEDPELARKAKTYFHPSQASTCVRQMWFDKHKAPYNGETTGEEVLRSHLIFETGTYTHVFFQNLCERAGVLRRREFLVLDDKLGIIGHADGVLMWPDRDDTLLEIKTINARGFSQLHCPMESHKKQMHLYMKSLKLKEANLVYLEKDKHAAKEFIVPFDEDFYKKEVEPRVHYYYKWIKSATPPPQEGYSPSAMPCLYCSFSKVCFDDRPLKRFLSTLKIKTGTVSRPSNKVRFKFNFD